MALQVPTAEEWSGNDGPWTSFPLWPGNDISPSQIPLIPSTSMGQTFIVNASTGCPEIWRTYSVPGGADCNKSRSTWPAQKPPNSDLYGVGKFATFSKYGFEHDAAYFWTQNISLGFPGSQISGDQPTPMLLFSNWNFSWTGLLGIDYRPTNLTNFGGQGSGPSSFLQRLKDSGQISTLSWGYHVGKRWGGGGTKGVFGALAFGGFHSNRIVPHDYQFSFDADEELALTLSVQKLTLSDTTANQTTMELSDAFPAMVDSTRPYIYLPEMAYESVLRYFNLTLNEASGHILISEPQHKGFLASGASFMFELADGNSVPNQRRTVKISLPYSSLALKLGFPYVIPESWYLPIRKGYSTGMGNNYVLGRAFLQEAYLVANYDQKFFKVHQVNWTNIGDPRKDTVVPMDLLATSPTLQPGSKTAAIAGVVAGVAGFLLIVLLCYCFVSRRRRKQRKQLERDRNLTSPTSSGDRESKLMEADSGVVHEMPSTVAVEPIEMDGKTVMSEMPDYNGVLGTQYKPVELDPTEKAVFEMEGSPGVWNKDEKTMFPPIEQRLEPKQTAVASSENSAELGSGTASDSSTSTSGVSSLGTQANSNSNSNSDILGSGIDSTPRSRLPRVTVMTVPGLTTGRRAEHVVPASPIPQTPLEYYGGRIPEPRMNRALQRLRAAERGELPVEKVRNAVLPTAAMPKYAANTTRIPLKPAQGNGQQGRVADMPPVSRFISSSSSSRNNSPEKEARRDGYNTKAVKPTVQGLQDSSLAPASPIPQTPLEYYGKAPGLHGPQPDRGWIGRAPEAPAVNLIPATPSIANANGLLARRGVNQPIEDNLPPVEKS